MRKILSLFLIMASFNVSAEENAAAPAAVPPEKPAKLFAYAPKATDIAYGKEGAPVTIVEYASLSCPHCSHFFTKVLPDIDTKYIETGKVRLVYRDFPLNKPALDAATLVQCADKDRREIFVKVLFSTQEKWAYGGNNRDALASIAQLGGLPKEKFDRCMADKELQKAILEVEKEAGEEFKVSSTPTFYINNILHKEDHEFPAMSKAIDAAISLVTKK